MLFSFISVSQQQHDHTQNSLLCWYSCVHDMWVPVTMAWSVVRLQMVEMTSRYGG